MRSVVVVLPASMWAQIPILRMRSCGYCRAMIVFKLPAVVCERFVRVGHSVGIFPFLYRSAFTAARRQYFVGESFKKGFSRFVACELDNPTHRQGGSSLGAN